MVFQYTTKHNLNESLVVGLLTVVTNIEHVCRSLTSSKPCISASQPTKVWLKAIFSQCREYQNNQWTITHIKSCCSFTYYFSNTIQLVPTPKFWTVISIQLLVFDHRYMHAHLTMYRQTYN